MFRPATDCLPLGRPGSTYNRGRMEAMIRELGLRLPRRGRNREAYCDILQRHFRQRDGTVDDELTTADIDALRDIFEPRARVRDDEDKGDIHDLVAAMRAPTPPRAQSPAASPPRTPVVREREGPLQPPPLVRQRSVVRPPADAPGRRLYFARRRRPLPPPLVDVTGMDWRTAVVVEPERRTFPRGTAWDVARRPTDLVLSFEDLRPDLMPLDFDPKIHCGRAYQIDPISLDSIADIYRRDPKSVGRTADGRCFDIHALVDAWEAGLALYDPQSAMVVPQYPRDPTTRDEPMPPDQVIALYRRARPLTVRRTAIEELVNHEPSLLIDLYNFIKMYDRLVLHYANLSPGEQDPGAWNRRDLQAIRWLQHLYRKYDVPDSGYRKFSDIPSGRNAPEIYYSCFLTAFLVKRGFTAVVTNPLPNGDMPEHPDIRWRLDHGRPCDGVLCRPCVSTWIVDPPSVPDLPGPAGPVTDDADSPPSPSPPPPAFRRPLPSSSRSPPSRSRSHSRRRSHSRSRSPSRSRSLSSPDRPRPGARALAALRQAPVTGASHGTSPPRPRIRSRSRSRSYS